MAQGVEEEPGRGQLARVQPRERHAVRIEQLDPADERAAAAGRIDQEGLPRDRVLRRLRRDRGRLLLADLVTANVVELPPQSQLRALVAGRPDAELEQRAPSCERLPVEVARRLVDPLEVLAEREPRRDHEIAEAPVTVGRRRLRLGVRQEREDEGDDAGGDCDEASDGADELAPVAPSAGGAGAAGRARHQRPIRTRRGREKRRMRRAGSATSRVRVYRRFSDISGIDPWKEKADE